MARLAVLHGSSTTWFQTSCYCRAKVEFNSINWVRQGSHTTFETGLKRLRLRVEIFIVFQLNYDKNFHVTALRVWSKWIHLFLNWAKQFSTDKILLLFFWFVGDVGYATNSWPLNNLDSQLIYIFICTALIIPVVCLISININLYFKYEYKFSILGLQPRMIRRPCWLTKQ